jgi:hypothetical protein
LAPTGQGDCCLAFAMPLIAVGQTRSELIGFSFDSINEPQFFCYHRAKQMIAESTSSSTCVLLFSGGRDSTLAAIRLARSFSRIVLVTVKSPYMTGASKLELRLEELKRVLSVQCEWLLVPEKRLLANQAEAEDLGCIGCHFGYFASAYSIARQLDCNCIACGFVEYQNSWVEQTPYSVVRLRHLMSQYGIKLVLPVAELRSKREVQMELTSYGVTQDSLELKCSKQGIDPGLAESPLRAVVDEGIEALHMALQNDQRSERTLKRFVLSREPT